MGSEQRATSLLSGESKAGLILAVSYAAGLLGWVWDDLSHLSTWPLAALWGHLLMYAAGLTVLACLVSLRHNKGFAASAAGFTVFLIGFVVDLVWHANASGSEKGENMLYLPGHAIQLVGWAVGVMGAGAELIRTRAQFRRSNGSG